MTDLFLQLKNVKDANKHLIIVETFVENDILFKEISELIYEIITPAKEKVLVFFKTGVVQIKKGNKLTTLKPNWIEFLLLVRAYQNFTLVN